jgi:malonate-semialdehyde dehydrogenase (acetylating)/methylmalonate-semialdehyde dehydrogenase
MFSFTGSRGSFRGDTNFYGKQVRCGLCFNRTLMQLLHTHLVCKFLQGINFYTQLKTVTQMWREQDVTHTQAAVAMPTMQ